jgi:hypothetical protein
MILLYINEIGNDYKSQKVYEFIFGEEPNILQDDWYQIPASGNCLPPDIEYIYEIGVVKDSDLDLSLVQNSDYFGVIDSVNGIIALGWEPFDINYEKRNDRLYFKYGETISDVETKLKKRKINLKIENIKNE